MGGCVHAGMCVCSCRNTHRLGRSDCAEERKKSNGKSPDSSTKASGCPSFGNKHKSSMAALKKTQRRQNPPQSYIAVTTTPHSLPITIRTDSFTHCCQCAGHFVTSVNSIWYTVSPLHPRVPNLQIQPTQDQKHLK